VLAILLTSSTHRLKFASVLILTHTFQIENYVSLVQVLVKVQFLMVNVNAKLHSSIIIPPIHVTVQRIPSILKVLVTAVLF
jgi:hypothetical protein